MVTYRKTRDEVTRKTRDDVDRQIRELGGGSSCGTGYGTDFPDDIDFYTTKSPSDTICDFHINDPQYAIHEIETKLGVTDSLDDTSCDFIYPPVGSVMPFMGSTAPGGYLECDGSAVSRSTYSRLYSVLGVKYGNGDGTTTFNLPDLRGQFIRGWSHGAGTDPNYATRTDRGDGTTGDNVGTKQAYGLRSHYHEYWKAEDGTNTYGGWYLTLGVPTNMGSSGGNETRPKNINVMFIIRC